MTILPNRWFIPNFYNILSSQFVKRMFLSRQRSAFNAKFSAGVQGVLAAREVMKVQQARIVLFAVSVINFFSCGAFSDKCFGYELVDSICFGNSIFTQPDRGIASSILRNMTGQYRSLGALPGTTENISKFINLIKTLVSVDVSFFHENSIAGVL